MDNPNAFEAFIEDVLDVNLPRNREAITHFIPTFGDLLNTTDKELDDFVTATHSSNSGRANNAKITRKEEEKKPG